MLVVEHQNVILDRLERVSRLIGRTPLHYFESLSSDKVKIFAKLEYQQFSGSVKARAAFQIIKTAVTQEQLGEGKRLLDATSGNTGIAYASIAAAAGIPVTLALPENASKKRKLILKGLGAQILYTSPFEGTDGAQKVSKELYQSDPDLYYYADQYTNENNYLAHYYGTAQEIWRQTKGTITHFVAGLGTTGTFVGTVSKLKALQTDLQAIALQPDSPMHGLEGWKHLETAVVPKIFQSKLVDAYIPINTSDAFEFISRISRKEGLLLSPSAAANLLGAYQLALTLDEGVIVTTLADDSSKYDEIFDHL